MSCLRNRNLALALWPFALALALGAAILTPQAARAHTRVEAGPYALVVGWVEEPPIVGAKNAVWLQILEGDTPISNQVRVDLEASIFYGGHSFLGIPTPAEKPGEFVVEIFPTVRGTYELQLTGIIGETSVDILVELDEVQPASALQFPEPLPDPLALQASLEEAQRQARTANALALAGLVIGVLGLGLGLVSFLRRTKA